MANPVYDGPGRAEHYAQGRWQGTARRRRTARKEGEHFSSMLQECGPLADVADAPCGTGRFAPLLQKATLSCLGADLSSAMLQQCRQAGAYPGKLLQADSGSLPWTDQSLDLLFCSRLMHHFPEVHQRRPLFAEAARVSRRWWLTTCFDSASFQSWRHRLRGRRPSRHAMPQAQFLTEAAEAGFRMVRRQFVARGISEQVLLLMERAPEKILVDDPTVRVAVFPSRPHAIFSKEYFFPSFPQRLAGWRRHSFFGQPKAEREAENLRLLAKIGVPVPAVCHVWTRRDLCGFVLSSRLDLEYLEGAVDLQRFLESGECPSDAFWQETGRSMRRMHDAGFFHRGMAARNLLVTRQGAPVWIDPAKSRWRNRLRVEEIAADCALLWAPLLPGGPAAACLQDKADSVLKTMQAAYGELPSGWERTSQPVQCEFKRWQGAVKT